ncbi:hypothetical protein QTJ16_005276 [Diplocarpon rosae]|uniref:3-dehydrosphinganine reductase n=1 Tax=Diplocarpon rosae TaxID=946125 RepID=A0AAD9SZH9_9HELO|nr:hypothetical protein QTJ16_005276 [Diplocarpon rosae]
MASVLNLGCWTVASVLVGLLASLPVIMGFFGGNKFNVRGKTVLLTGASEGMGRSVAIQLAQKGANVIIVARNVGKLEEALAMVKASAADPTSQRCHYISADLSTEVAADWVIAEAMAWNHGQTPDIVWCMAGGSHPSLFLETPKSILRQQMDLNYWSCSDMAQAILGKWLAPDAVGKGGPKHLIFTSSVVAMFAIAGYAPYSPGKAAIKSLSDTLAQEVLLYGESVKVHTVFPATIDSPGLQTENRTKPEITLQIEEGDAGQTPDVVAAKSIKGLENGEYLVVTGLLSQVMRACSWGSSRKNNWLWDTVLTWILAPIMFIITGDLDRKVRAHRKKNGHPSTYSKKA